MEVVDLVDADEGAVQVFHLLRVACQARALLIHLSEGFGQGFELFDVVLRGGFHLRRKYGLCAAQKFVVRQTDDGGKLVGLLLHGGLAFGGVVDFVDGLTDGVSRGGGGGVGVGIDALSGSATDDDGTACHSTAHHGHGLRGTAAGNGGLLHTGFHRFFGGDNLFVGLKVGGEFLTYGVLVEGAVEGLEEEHEGFGTHTQEEHEVAAGKVGKFEEGTEDYHRCAPGIGVIEEGLARHTVDPVLHAGDGIEFEGHILMIDGSGGGG